MKFVFWLVCCLYISVAVLRADAPPLTLEAATDAALAHNPSLVAARANWEALKASVPQAAAWEDLSVSIETRAGRFVDVPANGFTDHALAIEQKLPLNGKNLTRARAASAEAVAAYEQLRRAELDLRASVGAAYWRLANADAQLELNRQNESLLQEAASLSRTRYEAGTQTQADVLEASVEALKLTESRADLALARSDAKSALNVLMNQPARAPVGDSAPLNEMDAGAPAHSASHLDALALLFRPEVRIAQTRVDAARARLELSRRSWLPDPALRITGQQYNGASQAVSEVDAGITFTVPWLNAGKYRAENREAAAALAQRAAELEAIRAETLGRVRDALSKAETLHHHYEVYRDQLLPLARQAVAASRSGYENAKNSFADLIAAERTLRDAQADSLQHLADYRIALAELAAVAGIDLQNMTPAK